MHVMIDDADVEKMASEIEGRGQERDKKFAGFLRQTAHNFIAFWKGESTEVAESTDEAGFTDTTTMTDDANGATETDATKGEDTGDVAADATTSAVETDITKGTDAADVPGHIEAVDLIKGVSALGERLDALQVSGAHVDARIEALTAKVDAIGAENALLKSSLSRALDALEALHTGQVDLVKGMGEIYGALREGADRPATPVSPDPRTEISGRFGDDRPPVTREFGQAVLTKGYSARILGDAHLVHYQQHGTFHADPAAHESIAAKLRALTPSTTT